MAFSWRKKMVEKAEFEEDMSMEEILSSIRKYVIDEKEPALPASATSHALSSPTHDEDVIELRQPLDEPGTVAKKDQQPTAPAVVTPILSAAAAKPSMAATLAANIPSPPMSQPQTSIQEKRQHHTPFRSAQYPFHPMPPLPTQPTNTPEPSKINTSLDSPEESLISAKTASDVTQSLARLAEITQQSTSEKKPALKGDTTLEQLITEVTKPLIKTWLDQNLAPLVETMVSKEIERISRR